MRNQFFNLSPIEQLALIKQAGDQLDISDIIIEKDLWVCWLLEKIFALPMQMAFKGDTSLSKVFSLINRFSEDCDITIDYRNFMPQLDLEHTSRTQFKKISDQLKARLKAYVLETILPYLQAQVLKTFPEKIVEIKISENGEQLHFYYPSVVNTAAQGYLRDHVLIEFGVRNSAEPCEHYPVLPYLAQLTSKDLGLPKPMIATLSPIRTFWEKATLIHVECHRGRRMSSPERLSRHWYDLYRLNNSWVSEQALSSRAILKSVIEHKKAFFNASYAHYEDCLNGKFCLIPATLSLENLAKDYSQMIDAGMFQVLPPKFDSVIKTLTQLERKINVLSYE